MKTNVSNILKYLSYELTPALKQFPVSEDKSLLSAPGKMKIELKNILQFSLICMIKARLRARPRCPRKPLQT